MNARKLILATLCVMVGGLLFTGAAAQAAITHSFTGKAFGPEGISAGEPLGAFESLQGVTVEQSTGDVYVYDAESDGGAIFKFNAAGKPVDFSGLGSNVIEEVGEVGEGEGEIAVDDSGGPDSGDIYFASGESGTENVLIFNAKGQPAGELKEEEGVPWGEPCGVAVDPAGNVYVGLYFTGVNEYTPKSGTLTDSDYVSSLAGPAVKQTCNIAADSKGDVYTTQFSGPGSVTRYESSQFGLPEAEGTLIDETGHSLSVDPISDEVFIDESNEVAQYDSSGSRLDTFAETGPGALTEEDSTGVAVDHASGQVYIDGEGQEEGEPDGERAVEIFGAGVVIPDVSIESESELQTTSVTLNGTVNTDSAGSATCRFEYGTSEPSENTIACSASVPSGSSPVPVSAHLSTLVAGTTYHYRLTATNTNGTNHSEEAAFTTLAVTPPTGPPVVKGESSEQVGTNGAVIKARIAPEGLETQYHFEYGASASYGTSIPIPDGKIPAGFGEQNLSASLTSLTPGTTYHFRVVASNAGSPTPIDGPDETFTTIPAALIETSALDVTDVSATLQTQIDPQGNDTHAYFQYGATSCAANPSACTSIPSPPGFDVGSGNRNQSESVSLQGLTPDTTYYYRVVADNTLGTTDSVEHTFTTQGEDREGLVLPDGRQYEMVSPPDKHGALIKGISEAQGTVQASEAGGAISYAAQAPIVADPPGNQLFNNQILSVRGPEGWSSRDIAPSNETVVGVRAGKSPSYDFFSSDLSFGFVEPAGGTPLSPEATEKTVYLRVNGACEATPEKCYLPLVTATNVPSGTKFGEKVEFEGASPDLSHVVLGSGAALTSTPITEGGGLYEWTAGQLQLVSVLPQSEGGAPARNPKLGEGSHNARNTVSNDGSRVVWQAEEHLYMRDTATQETVQLDSPAPGAPENHGAKNAPVFQTASSDGSKVFFTDAEQLTEDSTAGSNANPPEPDLYECEMVEGPGGLACDLRDLTVDEHEGEHANVQGLIPGASEDGSYVYFVATGVLSSVETAEHEKAVAGSDNLYVRHENKTTFIASLSGEDNPDWAVDGEFGELGRLPARVSPDGRYLAFMSDRSLTGYDNTDAVRGTADEEVFSYDAISNHLVCASCNPTGARPVGLLTVNGLPQLVNGNSPWLPGRVLAANIPGWTIYELGASVYQSRYLSDSGRLFFDSDDALVPQDVNGKEDVYEYEPPGVGSCETSNTIFSARSDGCIGLISSGTSDQESAFMDASASGDDVFFLTSGQLLPQDHDTAEDVYDAHACSQASPCVPSPPASPPPCDTADSCKAAPSQQPGVFGASGSATFSGAGNLVAPLSKAKVKAKVKPLTRAQKLAKALKACKRERKSKQRVVCEARARKRYGARAKAKGSSQQSRMVHVKRNGR